MELTTWTIIGLGIMVAALLVAMLLVRQRERRTAALIEEERRLRDELEKKTRDLARSAEEVKETHQRLIQAEKVALLSSLVAGIAHELNNPLAVISGFAELLLAKATDPESKESLEAIHSEAKRCSRIVQNLLSFSRPQRATRGPVDLNEIAEQVLELLRYKLSLDDVVVDLELDRHAPPALGDVSQLQQAALHLIMHAHRLALDAPPEERRIEIATRGENNEVVFSVTDTGKPIAPADLSRVFDPFFVLGGHGREGGLGLSVAYGIATEHGGTIAAAPVPGGRGTRFLLRLPVARGAGSESRRLAASGGSRPGTAAAAAAAAAAPAGPRPAVLVADDEDRIVRLLTQVLTREGYRCVAARDGLEAFEMLRSGGYDAAIIDVVMPRLSGIEVYRRLARDAPAVAERLIFTTGDTGGIDTQKFLVGLGNRWLRKPFEIEDVTRLVAEVIRDEKKAER